MDIHLPDYKLDDVMDPYLWKLVKYFTPEENWGSPYKMNVHLIFYVDMFREMLGVPVDIYCAYESEGHSPTGEHPKGLAVDLAPHEGVSHMDAFMCAMRLPFTGIGMYKWWKPRLGLHLDRKRTSYETPRRMWYRDKLGIYHNIHTQSDMYKCLSEG